MDWIVLGYDPTTTYMFILLIGFLAGYIVGRERDIPVATFMAMFFAIVASLPALTRMPFSDINAIATVIAFVSLGYGVGAVARAIVDSKRMVAEVRSMMSRLSVLETYRSDKENEDRRN